MIEKQSSNLTKVPRSVFANGLPVSLDGSLGSCLARYFAGSFAGASATVNLQNSGSIPGLQAGTQNTVALPVGVGLDDIRVVGRDLVIEMPDGTEMVIPDGAVFIPEIIMGGAAVPPAKLAAVFTLNLTIERALATKGNP